MDLIFDGVGDAGNSRKKPLVVPPVYLLLFILGQVAIHRYWPLAQLFDGPIRYSGLMLLALGILFVGWGACAGMDGKGRKRDDSRQVHL